MDTHSHPGRFREDIVDRQIVVAKKSKDLEVLKSEEKKPASRRKYPILLPFIGDILL